MTDRTAAIAAARHAHGVALFDDSARAKHACVEALHDLLAVIDAEQAPPAAVFKSTAKRVAALQALDAAQAPPAAAVSAEPIGWVFQHEDTGRMTFCASDGINTPEVFQRLNPRHVLCGAAYTKAPPAAAVFKITVSDHTGTHDYEAWAGLQAPPAAAVPEEVRGAMTQADEALAHYDRVAVMPSRYALALRRLRNAVGGMLAAAQGVPGG